MSYITGSLSFFSSCPRICRYDNGSSICDKGHKLTYLGRCLSQSIGKLNSTGYLPTYQICQTDYISKLNAYLILYGSAGTVNSEYSVLKDNRRGNISGEYLVVSYDGISSTSNIVQYVQPVSSYVYLYGAATSLVTNLDIFVSEVGVTGTYTIFHAGKNVVHHTSDTYSDYWPVDTYSSLVICKNNNQLDEDIRIYCATKPTGLSYIVSNDTHLVGISNPYKAIYSDIQLPLGMTLVSGSEAENPISICVDDITPPTVSGEIPLRGSHLNSTGSYVEFKILDSVGGVDIGLLSVSVSGDFTVQPHGPLIVSSGVDQTGGHVSITGDSYAYTVRYIPHISWSEGDTVRVTISGQDNEPTIGGTVWSCYPSDTRNVFGESYVFNVAATNNFGASLTVVPDTSPPYLSNATPIEYSRDNDAYTQVIFDIVDDISGVKRSSINVDIDGESVVLAGVAATSEAVVSSVSGGYRITYTPSVRFEYGETVVVVVSAMDQYVLSPNGLSTAYYFSIIGEGSLIIENFSPEEDSSYLAATKYICADVYDTSFGLKDAYLTINGTTYSGSRTSIIGNLDLSSSVSGTSVVSGTSLYGAVVEGFSATGCSISWPNISLGTVVSGSVVSGTISGMTEPFDEITPSTVVSAYLYGGTLVDGILLSALVNGVNWDGKYVDSTVYGVTVSGATFSNTVSTSTVVSGEIGYTVCARPTNDYNYTGVITSTVHAENRNSWSRVIKNEAYKLYHGYRVLEGRYDMGHSAVISVFARAVNRALLNNKLSSIYQFRTYSQPSTDIGATITPTINRSDISAAVTTISPTYSYGETITVEFYVKDKAGNALGPYTFTYTIESE